MVLRRIDCLMLLNSAKTEINKMITLPETIFFLFTMMSGSVYLTDPCVHFICIYYLDTENIRYTVQLLEQGCCNNDGKLDFDLALFKQLWQFPSTFFFFFFYI